MSSGSTGNWELGARERKEASAFRLGPIVDSIRATGEASASASASASRDRTSCKNAQIQESAKSGRIQRRLRRKLVRVASRDVVRRACILSIFSSQEARSSHPPASLKLRFIVRWLPPQPPQPPPKIVIVIVIVAFRLQTRTSRLARRPERTDNRNNGN
ncbi:hypothetical protein DBV15_07628 [Temnothorax longispinosus]|uniref:Uncharacterized protein n=1 Tax=Temnothorax longispinosus TaxID=300112 RepID=A0A4S2KFI5_9HYME|nr:hypothetical protein DBV15_07628 [Temnothorax longispinosus]